MLYEYRCPSCGEKAELQRKVAERNDPVPCDCGNLMERTVSRSTGFSLKGGGWYRDGYSGGEGS